MTELCIHIGTHKTGTTAIQNALRHSLSNASQDTATESWTLVQPPYELIQQVMLAEEYSETLAGQLQAALVELTASDSNSQFVLSHEGLSGAASSGYRNSNVVAKILREATREFNVSILVYLRRQDDWLESMYTQNIHEGHSIEFDAFLNQFAATGSLDYQRFLAGYQTEFGKDNLEVRSYHQSGNEGIVADFAKVLNCQALASHAPAERANPSYSKLGVEVARLANPRLDVEQRRLLRSALQKTMAKPAAVRFSYFLNSQRQEFVERFVGSNQAVADEWFAGDCQKLFPSAEPPESAEPITIDPAAVVDMTSASKIADLAVQLLLSGQQNPVVPKPHQSKRSPFTRAKSALRRIVKR